MARPRKKKEAPPKKKVKRKPQAKPQVRRRVAPTKKPAKKTPARTPRSAPSKAPPRAPKAPPKAAKKAAAAPAKKPSKGIVGWVTKFIEKPSTTPDERAAAKKSLKPTPKKKVVRDKRGRVRDYKKEYQRRLARAEIIQRGLPEPPSTKGVARGHPRRERGEMGFGELKQLRRAVALPSIGQQRKAGESNPAQYELRIAARARLAEIAGVSPEGRTRSDADKFAAVFVGLGLGTLHDAYTLYFSP